jgi:glutaminase
MRRDSLNFMQSPVVDFLQGLHDELKGLVEGEVATYIPELAKADPDLLGICLVTASGQVYAVGDTEIPFTIQSISKPFVYGLALEDNGQAEVLAKVGVEPSGDAFNSISLEPGTGRPLNPMINAGAIATAGLIPGGVLTTRLRRILQGFASFAGRELSLDEAVYRSESETGHRNRAIGHMLRNFDILSSDPDPTVELYFQQCSISVTCRDLGIMAATLANRGVNPITGRQAVRGEYVADMLSVMSSCGMYDWAGEWIYKVGMPAKSGVSGGILAVLPGELGIGVFSPRLDSHGNSVRGIRVCEAISQRLDLHLFDRRGLRNGAVRLVFDGSRVNSHRVRTAEESALLRQHGRRIVTMQLQGNLTFAATAAAVHKAQEKLEGMDFLVLDLAHVLSINDPSARLLYELTRRLSEEGKTVLYTHPDRIPLLGRVFRTKLGEEASALFRTFEDNDPALEYCEDRLLEALGATSPAGARASLADCELLEGFTADEVGVLERHSAKRSWHPGEVVIEAGAEADELILLEAGRVSVFVGNGQGRRRLATFSEGMAFGEMALIDRSPRSATIVADTAVVCRLLSRTAFERLGDDCPSAKIKLLENLARGLSRKLRKANVELSVFE